MSLTQNCQKYYLTIRPVACEQNSAAPYIEALSEVTGVDRATVKQKIVGTALQVFKSSSNLPALRKIQDSLEKENYPSAIISKSNIEDHKNLVRATMLDISKGSITLLSSQSEALLSFNGTSPCFIVLSCTNVKGIQNKHIATAIMQKNSAIPIEKTLKFIFTNHPIMDIYTPKSSYGIRVDGEKFNYGTLGKENKGSVALNFPHVIRLIQGFSSEGLLETGFGENLLPFLHSIYNGSENRVNEDFSSYSRFAFLAYKEKLFNDVAKRRSFPLDSIGGISWAGPLLEPSPEEIKQKENTLPPAPTPGIACETNILSRQNVGLQIFVNSISKIRHVGPPEIVYPVTASLACFLSAGFLYKNHIMFILALFSSGVLLFIHAFVLLHRKRNIENCPTSKIRSMSMGETEVNGRARQKYSLRAPYSLTECVYYSYKIYKTEMTPNGPRRVISEYGESGNIPFYLEDDTGKVLILPKGSILKAGVKQTIHGDLLMGMPTNNTDGRKIVETIIPIGQFLYVKGFAHRIKVNNKQRNKELTNRLFSIKTDKKKIEKYDINNDGVISEEEWELARESVEKELMIEELSKEEDGDKIAIGKHPTGEFFYIADRREDAVVKSFCWKIPMFFVLGIGTILCSLRIFLTIYQN